MKKILSALLIAGMVLALGVSTAFASGLLDRNIWGGNNVIQSGDTINGDLTIFGGNTTIEDGATITGNMTVMGGNTTLAGLVEGDVVIFGGSLSLESTAVIEGNLVRSGGAVNGEEGYEVQGNEVQGFEDGFENIPFPVFIPRFVDGPTYSPFGYVFDWVVQAMSTLGLAVVSGLLAMVVMVLMPDQTARVTAVMSSTPGLSGGVGLLTLFAVPLMAVVIAITICLIPFSAVAMFVYAIAVVFGWLAFGIWLGDRLASALRWPFLSPVLAAALGTFIITLLANGLDLIPVFGWLLGLLVTATVASMGLGAVVLTRFGSRPYFATPPATPPTPTTELPPPFEPPMSDQPPTTSQAG
jgi:hypothetical protein